MSEVVQGEKASGLATWLAISKYGIMLVYASDEQSAVAMANGHGESWTVHKLDLDILSLGQQLSGACSCVLWLKQSDGMEF